MKTAIILFNLGGPDALTSVRPFLKNLFSDPAIIGLPFFLRLPLAAFISSKREEEAKHIYKALGGKSPLLQNTNDQAKALEDYLNLQATNHSFKCFVAMRYWHPMAAQTATDVAAWAPDKIIYLPLYPQFSTTTTDSSFKDFDKTLKKLGGVKTAPQKIGCYPTQDGFITAMAERLAALYEKTTAQAKEKKNTQPPRVLFSAHGLPQKCIDGGDPYQWQCEQTAQAIVAKLNIPNLDWVNCYQSRVGPLQWTTPYTDAEIARAGAVGVPLIICPIAFVSEHSETLFELDQQYAELAAEKNVPVYMRVPTASLHPAFIAGLGKLVLDNLNNAGGSCVADGGKRLCPKTFGKCVCLSL